MHLCSQALSFDAHSLTVPVIKWLGVLPSDIKRYYHKNYEIISVCCCAYSVEPLETMICPKRCLRHNKMKSLGDEYVQ